jgi:predicted TIM-barrel fold metal-dependent hydrolase
MYCFRESRQTLVTAIGFIAALVVAGLTVHAEEPNAVPVIDCHVHLWDTRRPEMTWPRPEHVELYRPFLPESHTPICRANGVKGVVVVLSGQALVDNQWNLDVTAHDPQLYRGVVGNLSKVIGTDEFAPLLTKLCQDDRYVGYRLSGRYQQGLPDAFLRDLRLTAKLGRTVDFLVGDYALEEVAEVARRIPDLKIMLDHFGGVQLDGGPLDEDWVRRYRAVAKQPNVYCKLSALYGRFKQQPAPTDLAAYKPIIDLALECFGEDRLIYGSDWPVTTLTGDYRSVIELTRSYFVDKRRSLAEKVFHDNAIRFYGIADFETASTAGQ